MSGSKFKHTYPVAGEGGDCSRKHEGCDETMRSVLSVLRLYGDHPYIKILAYLCLLGGPASLRKISRNVNLTHRNVVKYLDALVASGLIKVSYSERNLRLYTLTRRGALLEDLLEQI